MARSGQARSRSGRCPATGSSARSCAICRSWPPIPHVRDPSLHTDHPVNFRQLICPETGRLLGTEVVIDNAPPQWDIRPGYTTVRD